MDSGQVPLPLSPYPQGQGNSSGPVHSHAICFLCDYCLGVFLLQVGCLSLMLLNKESKSSHWFELSR